MKIKSHQVVECLMVVIMCAACFMACTDATRGKLFRYGDSASVKCYSGGTVIFDGRSTGAVKSEQNSDGYFFKNKTTGLMMEVSGNCVVVYDDK